MPLFGTRGAASVTGFGGLAKLGYLLRNSLRFRRGNSSYLSRTMSSTSTTYTVSAWVKRGSLTGYHYIFASGPNTASDDKGVAFDTTTNQIYVFNGSTQALSTAVFRDPAAWYHVVMSVNSGTATVYVNNVNTGISQSSMALGTNGRIGRYNDSSSANDFDGYMAEFNLIDGQALTPSSFGKTDAVTGQWIPIKFGGAYGTAGFYLPFTNTTSTSTLGNDFSGRGNNWTVNNISLTAGFTYDSMTDVPTLTSATASNYATINPFDYNSTYLTLNDGNLHQTYAGVIAAAASRATMAIPTTGKFYWEVYINATGGGSGERVRVGICRQATAISGNTIEGSATSYLQLSNGQKRNNAPDSNYGSGFSAGQYIQVLYDATAGAIYFGQNNSFANGSGSFNQTFATATAAFTSLSGEFMPCFITYGGADIYVNFGQQPFAYTPPSGFKALNTFNLP